VVAQNSPWEYPPHRETTPRSFPKHMICNHLHLPNAMIELRLKQVTVISACRRCINLQDLRFGRFLLGGGTYTQNAVIAPLWEGQPNIMGPGGIRELFSYPVRLYSLFIFLLRLPYNPSAAVSQQVPCVFHESLNTANGRCVLYVCMYVCSTL
jgi:hypothetical protein